MEILQTLFFVYIDCVVQLSDETMHEHRQCYRIYKHIVKSIVRINEISSSATQCERGNQVKCATPSPFSQCIVSRELNLVEEGLYEVPQPSHTRGLTI